MSKELLHLVVVSTQVLEVSEADVRQADHDGDDQHHKSEHGGRCLKACRHTTLELAQLAFPNPQLMCLSAGCAAMMLAVKLTAALVMNLTLRCFKAGIELKLLRKHFVC